MRWMVQFDDVLDADKLHGALEVLLGMKGWRRLGGRIRSNVRLYHQQQSWLAYMGSLTCAVTRQIGSTRAQQI